MKQSREQLLELLLEQGFEPETARATAERLAHAGLGIADPQRGQFICRWVNVAERTVPPEADTIIRTVTRTVGTHSASSTHWLDGLEPPPPPEVQRRWT